MINITLFTDLINNLPRIITSILYGYVFLSVYEFISFKDTKNQSHKIILSIVLNYILVNFFSIIPRIPHNRVVYLIMSILLGYVIGLIIISEKFNALLSKIQIHRTTNENFWDDVFKSGYRVEVFDKDGKTSYTGTCRYRQDQDGDPKIALTYYRILENGKLTDPENDWSEDKASMIVLNLKDFEKIRIYAPFEER